MKNQLIHSYYLQRMQGLPSNDYATRLEFRCWFVQENVLNDEAGFNKNIDIREEEIHMILYKANTNNSLV